MAKPKKIINPVEAIGRLCGYFNFDYLHGSAETTTLLRHKSDAAELLLCWEDRTAALKIFDRDSNPFSEKDSYLMSVTLSNLGFTNKSMFFENEDDDGECPGCPNCMPDEDEKIVTSASNTIQ